MSAETILHALLAADASVVAVVEDRIYPVIVPFGQTTPAIAYQRTATEYINAITNADLGRKVTFDIFCVVAEDIGAAEALGDMVAAIQNNNIVKLNRSTTYDADNEAYAVIITVDVWE